MAIETTGSDNILNLLKSMGDLRGVSATNMNQVQGGALQNVINQLPQQLTAAPEAQKKLKQITNIFCTSLWKFGDGKVHRDGSVRAIEIM